MTDKKASPINRRWLGRYAFRVAVYTPKGSCLEFEVPADEADAKAIMDTLTRLFTASSTTKETTDAE